MSFRILTVLSLLLVLALVASAAPTVTFSDPDVHSGNTWVTVYVAPDVATFVPNTSLAVELDFTFSHGLVGATLNESFWNVHGDNPGNNPFTGTVAEGLVVDTVNDTLFVAVGSELYANTAAVELMTIELQGYGFGFDINLGGHVVLPGTFEEYVSSRIAQNGVNFDGLQWMELLESCLGDYDGNGNVGNSDLTLLLDNWGDVVPPVPAGWNGTPPTPPGVGNDELTCFLDHWGEIYLDLSAAANPEPGAAALAATAVACLLATRCRGRAAS